ncbi:hypothetical protein EDC01DRAFT_667928 [Geopyxis carbonaria]|nr:hypothetical protein EDC01DRAFT_667928 [Geopyxis carbonaria]
MPSIQPAINFMILEITGLVLIVTFTVLRIITTWKKRKTRAESASEVLYVLASAFSVASASMVTFILSREIGVRRIAKSELDLYVRFNSASTLKLEFYVYFAYLNGMWLVKVAFLAYYSSLFTNVTTKLRGILYFAYFFIIGAWIASFSVNIGWCRPIYTNWRPQDSTRCLVATAEVPQTVFSITSILADLFILLLPVSLFQKIRLKRKEKVAVSFVIMVGLLSFIATVLRYSLLRASGALKVDQHRRNSIFNIHLIFWLGLVEITAASIAFALPAFRGFVLRYFDVIETKYATYTFSSAGKRSGPGGSRDKTAGPYVRKTDSGELGLTATELEIYDRA